MYFVRQLSNAIKAVVTGICILSVILSLILPYSSHYFSSDSKVSDRRAGELQPEKVEVSTSLLTSPAECLNTKVVQEFRSAERVITILDHPLLLTLHTATKSSHGICRYSRYLLIGLWKPSIVIALKKLLI